MRSTALNQQVVGEADGRTDFQKQEGFETLRQEFNADRLLLKPADRRENFLGDIDLSQRDFENISIVNAVIFGNLYLPKSGSVRLVNVLVFGDVISNGVEVEGASHNPLLSDEATLYYSVLHKFIDTEQGFRLMQGLDQEVNKQILKDLEVKVYLEDEIDDWLEQALRSGCVPDEKIDDVLAISDQKERYSKAREIFDYCERKIELDGLIIRCSTAHLINADEAVQAFALTDINQMYEAHQQLEQLLSRENQIDLWIETAINCHLVSEEIACKIKQLPTQYERYEEASKLIKW